MLGEEVYLMHIVEGSLLDASFLADVPHEFKKRFDDPTWGRLIEAELSLPRIREAQKKMIKHYGNNSPWFMDGYLVENPDIVICAFGTDDREGGRIFIFTRDDKETFMECKQYGITQGIPEEQIAFLE